MDDDMGSPGYISDDMESPELETYDDVDDNPKRRALTAARSRKAASKKSDRRNLKAESQRMSSPAVSGVSSVRSPISLSGDTYIMRRYGNFNTEMAQIMKTKLEKLIKGFSDWNQEEGRDFKSAEAELLLDPTSEPVNVFIKEVLERTAWEREYENLFNLRSCDHVPIFYCSLENTEEEKFFIITEKCEEFDEGIDKPLLKFLPYYLDGFHSLDYFHGDLGNPENIMVATRDGERRLVFIDLDDTYSLEENHTKDTELTEGKPLSRDDKISAFKFVKTDNPGDDKRNIFMACDRFSLMHSLLTLLGFKQLLPGSGHTMLRGSKYIGRNCLLPSTHHFYSVFLPNTKDITSHTACKLDFEKAQRRGSIDLEIIGNGNIFWNLEDTLRLVPVFNRCYDIFKENLMREREPFDGVDTILQMVEGSSPPGLEPGPEPEPERDVEEHKIASMKSSFARKKSKKKKNKKLKKSRRKTNRKNKKLKTKKSRKKTKRKYKR